MAWTQRDDLAAQWSSRRASERLLETEGAGHDLITRVAAFAGKRG